MSKSKSAEITAMDFEDEVPVAASSENPFAKKEFVEMEVKITIKKGENGDPAPVAEKMKVVRENVWITEDQANALNEGVLYGGNTYAKMYFPKS